MRLEAKLAYMNSVTGETFGNLPDAEDAYWAYIAANGAPAGEVSWDDVSDKPEFADVATSGEYSDLTGAPSLAAVATSGDYSDLSGAPVLADVATSGEYSDLSGTPSIPTELPPTAGSVVDASVSASAAIALSKLANVAAGTDGLSAGTIQATFQALATRIQALEDAAAEA